MAEEQKWHEPGGHRLCANNCGFFGCPTTLNLCSKCYKDHCLKEQQFQEAKLAMEKTLISSSSSSSSSSFSSSSSSSTPSLPPLSFSEPVVSCNPEPQLIVEGFAITNKSVVAESTEATTMAAVAAKPNRCATCRRRVGLIGFKCRCGITLCGSHRYPEQHGCTFDYKAMGKEAIAKANPVVKAEKLDHKI